MTILIWMGKLFAVLLVAVAVLFAISRLRGPTAEQAAALAVLNQDLKPIGRNAFAAIWLLDYDVPEGEIESVAATDVRRFNSLAQPTANANEAMRIFQSVAATRYRENVPSSDESKQLCGLHETDCLVKVRASKAALSKLLEKFKPLLERTEGLAEYAYYRNEFTSRLDTPFPNIGRGQTLLLTRNALDFAEGRPEAALTSNCKNVRAWRKLINGTDSLIVSMSGIATVSASARLHAQMLGELPVQYRLPGVCRQAFATADISEMILCSTMRGEYQSTTNTLASLKTANDPTGNFLWNLLFPVSYSHSMTVAEMAPGYAWACSKAARDAVISDEPVEQKFKNQSLARLSCVGNVAGCVLASISVPGFTPYYWRAQDYGARMRTIGTLVWLREHPHDRRPIKVRLSERPAELKSWTREIEVVDGGKALRIRQFDTKRGKYWQIPLPGYLMDEVGD